MPLDGSVTTSYFNSIGSKTDFFKLTVIFWNGTLSTCTKIGSDYPPLTQFTNKGT